MKALLMVSFIAAATAAAIASAADVGVSVSIGQPGFYGRLDIGDFPPPRLIYQQPRVIVMGPMERPPIYLRVPPGHARHWDKHCREYNACNERVYFVRDDWYSNEYAPRYREQHGNGRDKDRQDKRGGYEGDRGNAQSNNGRSDGNHKNQGSKERGRDR